MPESILMPSGFSIVMRSKEAATYRHCRYQSMQENKDMRLDKFLKVSRLIKRRTVLQKVRGGKILRLFTFQGESRILKKSSFHRDKNKACQGVML